MPYVIDQWREAVDRDTAWDPHAHPTHELLWNERGVSELAVDRRTWTITPGLGMWLPAGTIHRGFAPAGTIYRAAHFSIHAAPALAGGPVAIEVDALLASLLERLSTEELGAASRALTEAMVIDVLRPATRELLVEMPEGAVVGPVVAGLDRDPADPRGLAGWAAEVGVSPRTLARAFRAETGMSFGVWSARLRAQRAIAMLAAGAEVDEVAARVGYRSASAFGAALRRVTGLTPGAFRRV